MARLSSKNTGLTFVELMLAASIFAVLAVAVYSAFSTGISAWRSAQQAQNLLQDLRLSLDQISRDLENAVLYYPEEEGKINFVGEPNSISFYSLVDNFRSQLVYPELKKITYSLDGEVLKRWEQSLAQALQETQEEDSFDQMLTQVAGLEFFYRYGQEDELNWQQSWNAQQSIPQGAQIKLTLTGEEGLAYTKFVFIPIGKKGESQE
ncbi:MAG: prepilin-type N-terminal cleavage/methylation domain-containing protein [Candidatus Omnitrophica bacterium]|nr:prepilin-type N-terminal cleavage/methylation domain-containing protein [Candidatus Omnitrophota bacterium]